MKIAAGLVFLLGGVPALSETPATPPPGPAFTDFGSAYPVDADVTVPKGTVFRLLFDAHQGAKPGQINRVVERAARFINLNVAAGMAESDIHIAIVVHGSAGPDLLADKAYRARFEGAANASAGPVAELLGHGVQIYLCGQSAAAMGLAKADLLPGVKMAPSAMTMEALLQQQGYTLIP
ncbi:MAG: DsrE family protein [Sphingobium sp.]